MPRPTSPSDSDRSGQEVPDEQPTKNPDADGEEEVDDNEEEEYEIETIIDAKRGVFPDVCGFLVNPYYAGLVKPQFAGTDRVLG